MKKRVMIVKKERCNPVACGGYLCIRVSPGNRAGKEVIVKSKDGKVEVNEEVLTDADFIAAKKCPFNALLLVNLPAELDKKPIHRYGKNGFSLYNLPVPRFGKVVGILGRNGIGKSTAVKILAGVLKPNLGGESPCSNEELMNYFKGTEAQGFFEKYLNGEVKVSYKPQQVELIPKQYKGRCGELLRKVNQRGEPFFKQVCEALDLTKILGRELSHVSGGELQRIAVAAAALKKANVYIFDEPTSYLDVKQRLKASKFIRSLASPKTAVMVIEHDLIILDYLADVVHLMYGKETAYGVVSQAKPARNGINAYLSGYLKEENVRFRDHEIRFERRAPLIAKREVLASWEVFEERFGEFVLTAEEGAVGKGEVVGVLGENGIGKTSFAKVLAGEAGSHSLDLKLSYKPQYLEASEDSVALFLRNALRNKYLSKLELEPLLNLKLSELSGGELQKVMIAKALGEEAELYLLDEPSAYLDVEQRLLVSRVIRECVDAEEASGLIIDHDILFLDYLSDKLMVFEGKPAVHGFARGPFEMEEGMNLFLKSLGITFRRDEYNNRPRANKEGSVKDREQKKSGKYYYA